MQDYKLRVDEARLIGEFGRFFTSVEVLIGELIQNSYRAGATHIDLTYDYDTRILTARDNGAGASDPDALFAAGRSGWEEGKYHEPAGLGLFGLLAVCDHVEIASLSADTDGSPIAWTASFDGAAARRGEPITVHGSELWQDGTGLELRLTLPEGLTRSAISTSQFRYFYPITVRYNGEVIQPAQHAEFQIGPWVTRLMASSQHDSLNEIYMSREGRPAPMTNLAGKVQHQFQEQLGKWLGDRYFELLMIHSGSRKLIVELNQEDRVKHRLPDRDQLIDDAALGEWVAAFVAAAIAVLQPKVEAWKELAQKTWPISNQHNLERILGLESRSNTPVRILAAELFPEVSSPTTTLFYELAGYSHLDWYDRDSEVSVETDDDGYAEEMESYRTRGWILEERSLSLDVDMAGPLDLPGCATGGDDRLVLTEPLILTDDFPGPVVWAKEASIRRADGAVIPIDSGGYLFIEWHNRLVEADYLEVVNGKPLPLEDRSFNDHDDPVILFVQPTIQAVLADLPHFVSDWSQLLLVAYSRGYDTSWRDYLEYGDFHESRYSKDLRARILKVATLVGLLDARLNLLDRLRALQAELASDYPTGVLTATKALITTLQELGESEQVEAVKAYLAEQIEPIHTQYLQFEAEEKAAYAKKQETRKAVKTHPLLEITKQVTDKVKALEAAS